MKKGSLNSMNRQFHGCVMLFSRGILLHLLFLLPNLPPKCELRLKVGLKVLLCQIRLLRRRAKYPSSLFCYPSLLVRIPARLMRVQIKKLSKLFFSLFYFSLNIKTKTPKSLKTNLFFNFLIQKFHFSSQNYKSTAFPQTTSSVLFSKLQIYSISSNNIFCLILKNNHSWLI